MYPMLTSPKRSPSALPKRGADPSLPPFSSDPVFEQLLAHASVYCYSVDYATSRFRYVSPGIFSLLGYERLAWQFGGPLAAFEHVHPDDRECVRKIYAEIHRELLRHAPEVRTELGFVFTCRMRTARDHYLHLSHQLTFPGVDDRGRPLWDFTLVSDITALKVPQVCQLQIRCDHLPAPANRKTLVFTCHATVTFSRREIEILQLVAQGLESQAIADRLFISYHTVCTHRKNLLRKAGVKSPVELVGFGRGVGLV
ncbi:LuxR family transcriptional regulator [Neolewinella xylanilytica]|uniref:LuxR family transcriptional regulator n=1 Tax=Neolewinella xylanilytica TaxID=1514080 RepID=A0A2S6I8B8_9BACT|nr:LuxR C-terminal-related transcriptional regulator [Neolewinella xylanilytica]PPK87747.1 LuxR family transcriptional regulator [Neolewinella xylanilytica]